MPDSVTLGSKVSAGDFYYYDDGSKIFTVRYLYPKDINGDGVDEIMLAGFETNSSTAGAYSNASVHVFGWVNGILKEITDQWLPNGSNKVQGVGDVAWGDFNGDGRLDAFLSAYTDRDQSATAYVLINKGSSFQRMDLGQESWQHGVAVADINGDGYDDVFAPNYPESRVYFGSTKGLTKTTASGDYAGGMDAAVADFLGNGTVSAVVTDNDAFNQADTNLYAITMVNGVAKFTRVATLPTPLLSSVGSHDVRVEAVDFNRDGLQDVIVFSRQDRVNDVWPENSRVQFLVNQGSGKFQDVTASVLKGYRTDTGVAYAPVLDDFNGDGLMDIFVSDATFSADKTHDSTSILLQQSDGTFLDTGRVELSAGIKPRGGLGTVAQGPDGEWYLIAEKSTESPAGLFTTVESQLINWVSSTPGVTNLGTDKKDLVMGDAGADTLSGGLGKDFIQALGGADRLLFTADEQCSGGTYAVCVGSPSHAAPRLLDHGVMSWVNMKGKNISHDIFDGGAGRDTLVGTAGDDGIFLDDAVSECYKNDSARLISIERIEAGAGNDVVDLTSKTWSYGSVEVLGGDGNDYLWTSDGNDMINGGLGADAMYGGLGADRFVFDVAAGERDQIWDFTTGSDRIELEDRIYTKLAGDMNLSDNLAFGLDKRDANDWLIYDKGVLYYDSDGVGGVDPLQICQLVGAPEITYTDLWTI